MKTIICLFCFFRAENEIIANIQWLRTDLQLKRIQKESNRD